MESVTLLRQYFDCPAVTTDLITGFPEETEEEFQETLDFIARCRFADMHIFPYSIRPGTPAAKMKQVPKAIKEERAARAAEVAERMHSEYLASCVGKVFPVLYEQAYEGKYHGHAPNYMVAVSTETELHNKVCMTRIVGVEDGLLVGEIIPE